jgi:hypothetical protein
MSDIEPKSMAIPGIGVLFQPFAERGARYKPTMAKRRQAAQVREDQSFKCRQFTAEVILWAVRWYLMFPISYRDLDLMLLDRLLATVLRSARTRLRVMT